MLNMLKTFAICMVMSACSVDAVNSTDTVQDGLITGGHGSGGSEGGGTGPSPCEQQAIDYCTSIGYGGNTYCYLVFAQDCSAADAQNATTYATDNPTIHHVQNADGSCRLIWGAGPYTSCEVAAQNQCATLGFGGNEYCYLTFTQDCDVCDSQVSQAYCTANPGLAHTTNADGTCRLIWR